MGCVDKVTYNSFPEQGELLGCRTKVCFHYDTSKTIFGTVVRDDREEPWKTIIKLDDDRYIEASECQHSPKFIPKKDV